MKKNLLSFGYRTLENLCSTTYFAFTYPYSFIDLQNSFKQFDSHVKKLNINPNPLGIEFSYQNLFNLIFDNLYHVRCLIF